MSEMTYRDSIVRQNANRFLQENASDFRRIAEIYVARMGLSYGGNRAALADEIFQDAVLEALGHAERLVTARQPRAWFMGVMANIVKRRRTSEARREHFEIHVSALKHPDIESDDDLLDYFIGQPDPGPEQALETRLQLEEMLEMVSTEDAKLLRLALIHELQAEKLGKLLNVTPSAARVRVHRALARLRAAWAQRNINRIGEKHNG